jgi:two-component system OmpR family response regulator
MSKFPPLKKILYVEDEPDIQEITRISLEAIGGYTVKICSSGEEAIKISPSFSPDLILLDVMMPKIDGPTTLLELRKIESLVNVPIIFMTAKSQPQEIDHFISVGASNVIPKPFDPMTLAATLQAMWEEFQEKTRSGKEDQSTND